MVCNPDGVDCVCDDDAYHGSEDGDGDEDGNGISFLPSLLLPVAPHDELAAAGVFIHVCTFLLLDL